MFLNVQFSCQRWSDRFVEDGKQTADETLLQYNIGPYGALVLPSLVPSFLVAATSID